jgi:hypothetical protein
MNLHDTNTPVFVSMTNSATGTTCTRVNAAEILARTRDGFWQTQVEAVRSTLATSGKAASNALKKDLPAVLWSGEFSVRKNSGLVRHSGIICADFDHVADPVALRDQLATDAYCLGAHRSPSNDGVKALFAVVATRPHGESWRAVDAHCKAVYSLEIDKACKNVARLCFVSFDPDAYIAPGPVACIEYPPAEPSIEACAIDASTVSTNLSPGADYNLRGPVAALLRKHGWTSADDEEWTRPGKESGLSATLGRLDEHPRAFFNFSSDAQALPFAPDGIYQPWHVFALLECNGDFAAAACELRKQGYGAASVEETGPLYFDGQSYWRLERDCRFGRLGRTDAQLHLKMAGHSTRAQKGVDRSPNEIALYEIQRANRVTYAAPFCGRFVSGKRARDPCDRLANRGTGCGWQSRCS